MRFLEHRIAAKRIPRLIQKWLSAGVMEGGQRTKSREGTPQSSFYPVQPAVPGRICLSCALGRTSVPVDLGLRPGRGHPHTVLVYTVRRINDSRFASGAFDTTVHVSDFAGCQPIGTLPHGGFAFSLSASASGTRLLSAGGDMLKISPDGRYVVSVSQNGVGRVHDLQKDRPFYAYDLEALCVLTAHVAPSGQMLFVASDGTPVRIGEA